MPFETITGNLSAALAAAGLPGAVAMVGTREGVAYAQAFGARGLDDPAPMALDTLFWFASMTKAVTSVAALQLVERGALSLDAPIGALLPDLADPQVLAGFDAAGAPVLRPARRPITLRHLLTHTAGFGYDFMNADMVRARGPDGVPGPGSMASLRAPLLFDPGDRWEYGVSTDWVGLAVEAAGGKTLEQWFSAEIFGPLGMTDTHLALPADKVSRVAPLHLRPPGAQDLIVIPSPAASLAGGEFPSGGGGLVGSGGDYMRFLRMVLNDGALDGARILTPETVALLRENQIGDLRAGALTSVTPHMSLPFDLFPDMATRWSLGFLINPQPALGGRAAGSLAWAGLANTHYWIDPASGVAGLFLCQAFPFGDDRVMEAVRTFEGGVYAGVSASTGLA